MSTNDISAAGVAGGRGESGAAELEDAWKAYLAAARRELEAARGREPSLYPHYTEDGRWSLLSIDSLSRDGASESFRVDYEHGNWTAGFWFGVMWLLALDGDEAAADLAAARLDLLATRAQDTTTHDLGFLFCPSFVLPFEMGRITADRVAPAIAAARTIGRRFNASGDYIQAFGAIGDHRFAGTSTIDTLLNLPLLWWASAAFGESELFDIARRHARAAARLFFRADGSTYHLNHYDPLGGGLLNRGTFQGADEASCWSRGQAWGIAGFAWAHAATGEWELLEASERAASYFWAHLPDDGIPPWDFSDTRSDAPRDASAGAVAALGALLLGRTHPDLAIAGDYWERGVAALAKVATACINRGDAQDGILLHSCYSKPHRLGVDGSTAFGDYFAGLALALATGQIELGAVLGFDPRGPRGARGVAGP